MTVKIKDILTVLNKHNVEYRFTGNDQDEIAGISSLSNYQKNTVTWLKSSDYLEKCVKLGEIQLIVLKCIPDHGLNYKNAIVTEEPRRIFFMIAENFFSTEEKLPVIGQGTYISPDVEIGKNVKIGYNCVLNGDISIGDNTVIYNNVSMINRIRIGCNCIIHSGVIIGHDDLAYTEDENHVKTMIGQFGGVFIGDSVYIGAGSAINRGAIDDTIIKDGCKIDAMCHISHNVVIDRNCSLVSGTKIYGSVQIGENAHIATGTIRNQTKIGDNAVIGLGSVVLNDVERSAVMVGNPAKKIKQKKGGRL